MSIYSLEQAFKAIGDQTADLSRDSFGGPGCRDDDEEEVFERR